MFDAYKIRDLQNMLTMLNQLESEGVTDIRFARQRLDNHIAENNRAGRLLGNKIRKPNRDYRKCPSCDNGYLIPVINGEGLSIEGCRLCRYSEVV